MSAQVQQFDALQRMMLTLSTTTLASAGAELQALPDPASAATVR
jgi:hypothetical protein